MDSSSPTSALWEAVVSRPSRTALVVTGTAATLYVACKAWYADGRLDKKDSAIVTDLSGSSPSVSEDREVSTKPQKMFKRVLADNAPIPFQHLVRERNASTGESASDSDPHPYGPEIRALVAEPPLPPPPLRLDDGPPPMDNDCTWVDTPAQLADLAAKLLRETEFAVDTEQHSRRSFLGFTALLQISTRDEDFLVDAIALHDDMHLLAPPFANGAITKVLHGADSDCLWLQRDYHIYIVNLFDTARACDVLGKPQRSLAFLLKHYCGVATQKQYQLADWRQRPLPQAMAAYARADAHYLLFIADRLRAELLAGEPRANQQAPPELYRQAVARSNALCLQLYEKDLSNPITVATSILSRYYAAPSLSNRHRPHQQVPGSDGVFRALVRALCVWRDETARAKDESLRFVLSDTGAITIALLQPTDIEGLISAVESISDADVVVLGGTGASPIVRAHASQLCDMIRKIVAGGGRSAADFHGTSPSAGTGQAVPQGIARLTHMCLHLWSNTWSLLSLPLGAELSLRVARAKGAEEEGARPGGVVSLEGKKLGGKAKDAEQWRERFVQKFSCKAPVYHNCRIYAGDGRLLCFCDKKKLDWYIQRGLAETIGEDPPAIRLLFEPKGRPEDENNEFYIGKKMNRCVACGESKHYLRYRIIPSCYRQHFPEHLKSHRSHDIVLLCVDCHEIAHKAAEKHKRHVAAQFGVPLTPSRVSSRVSDPSSPNPPTHEDNGVDPESLRRAATAILRHGTGMPPDRVNTLMGVVRRYYGKEDISQDDIEAARVVGMGPRGQRKAAKCQKPITPSPPPLSPPPLQTSEPLPPRSESKPEEEQLEQSDNTHTPKPQQIVPQKHVDDHRESATEESHEGQSKGGEAREDGGRCLDEERAGKREGERGERVGKLSGGEGMLGHAQHGKRVVDMILEGGGEEGVRDFIQQWREVFVIALQPSFLPPGWDVRHSGHREFGAYSVYNPQRKGHTSGAEPDS